MQQKVATAAVARLAASRGDRGAFSAVWHVAARVIACLSELNRVLSLIVIFLTHCH